MFDFIDISLIDVIDVLMVGLLIYWLIRVVRGRRRSTFSWESCCCM